MFYLNTCPGKDILFKPEIISVLKKLLIYKYKTSKISADKEYKSLYGFADMFHS